jgi:dihydroxy-acid dehydratase
LSGSTNAILHLAAIAGRAGVALSLDRLNELSEETPVLVDLKPVGDNYMEDFYAAGGVDAVLRELKPLLHLDCITITGETLGEHLDQQPAIFADRRVVHAISDPITPKGGLVALFGSLAPGGAIVKRAAADARLLEHEGRAVVFESLEDLARRIDDPGLDVEPDDVLVLQNAGPRSESGMPEAGYLPIPKKLARHGVKDMVRISDARMSGTAFGTIVLHVTPEASAGGPLAVVRTGDHIRLSASERRIDLLVDKAEIDARLAHRPVPPVSGTRGYDWLYRHHVLQADQGCDFDFLISSGRDC